MLSCKELVRAPTLWGTLDAGMGLRIQILIHNGVN